MLAQGQGEELFCMAHLNETWENSLTEEKHCNKGGPLPDSHQMI